MRRVLGVLMMCSVVVGGQAHAARYTLAQLLDKVQHDYPGVLAAEASVQSSYAQLAQARRAWAPSGDFTAAFGPAPNVSCSTDVLYDNNGVPVLDKLGNKVIDPSCKPDWGHWNVVLNLSLNLNQPIYTFGKIESATAYAKAGIDAQKGYLAAAKADVMVNAMRAYWGIKSARAARDTLDEGIDKLKEWVTKIEDDLNASKGGYNEGDLARLKLALDEAKLNRGDIARNLSIAEAGLKIVTDDPHADVDEDELDLMETVARPVTFWLDAAFVHRPEAKLLDASVAAAKGFRQWKRAEMLPDLGLNLSAGYLYAPDINAPVSKTGSFNGYLALHTPLDWGLRYGRLQQARADETAANLRRRQGLGGIAVEVDRAYADAEEARNRSNTLGHGAKVARGWYNSIDQNMSAGLVNDGREIVDAARAYFGYRIRYLQSIFDANMALVALRRATGVE